MNIFIDIGVVAIFALFIYSGYKRGILYMIINLIGTLIAAFAASFFASSISVWLYNVAIQPRIASAISDSTKNITATDPFKIAEEAVAGLSNFTMNAFSSLGITAKDIANQMQIKNLDIKLVIEGMIKPVVLKVISMGLTFIIFGLLMIVVSIIAGKFTKAMDHTMLGMPNRVAGAAVGIAEALLIVMVLAVILSFIISFVSPESYASWNQELDNTLLYKQISKISIPDAIISQVVPK